MTGCAWEPRGKDDLRAGIVCSICHGIDHDILVFHE